MKRANVAGFIVSQDEECWRAITSGEHELINKCSVARTHVAYFQKIEHIWSAVDDVEGTAKRLTDAKEALALAWRYALGYDKQELLHCTRIAEWIALAFCKLAYGEELYFGDIRKLARLGRANYNMVRLLGQIPDVSHMQFEGGDFCVFLGAPPTSVRPAIVLVEIALRDESSSGIRKGAEALRSVSYPPTIAQNGVTLYLAGVVEQRSGHFRSLGVALRGATPFVGNRVVSPGVFKFDSLNSAFGELVVSIEDFDRACAADSASTAASSSATSSSATVSSATSSSATSSSATSSSMASNATLCSMSRSLRTFFSNKTPLSVLAKQDCFLPLILVYSAQPESLIAALKQQSGGVGSSVHATRRCPRRVANS